MEGSTLERKPKVVEAIHARDSKPLITIFGTDRNRCGYSIPCEVLPEKSKFTDSAPRTAAPLP
jgi:hypothetical protein